VIDAVNSDRESSTCSSGSLSTISDGQIDFRDRSRFLETLWDKPRSGNG
jgi:hypothetical protein